MRRYAVLPCFRASVLPCFRASVLLGFRGSLSAKDQRHGVKTSRLRCRVGLLSVASSHNTAGHDRLTDSAQNGAHVWDKCVCTTGVRRVHDVCTTPHVRLDIVSCSVSVLVSVLVSL
jgi:hypothetical protein